MQPKRRRKKRGTPFEIAVAEVVRVMDPHTTVSQGEWVLGPDGWRDRDVFITGTVEGQERTILVECKDYDPSKMGPVGIREVDGLDSKRRDLKVDVALICSNAGFTEDAVRKAKRVGIGLIGVMRKGDRRVRFQIPEELYTRRIKVERLVISLQGEGAPIELLGVPFEAVTYQGVPFGNWILRKVVLFLAGNPIVNGEYTGRYSLTTPILLDLSTRQVSVDQIGFQLRISGGWFAQQVTLDASAGVYDWLRRRVRLAPGPSQFHINNVDVNAGQPISRPPDEEFEQRRRGEIMLRLLTVEGLELHEPVPDLDQFVIPEDLAIEIPIESLSREAYTSAATNFESTTTGA